MNPGPTATASAPAARFGPPFWLAWFLGLTLPLVFSLPRLPQMPADARSYWDAHWREAVQRKIDHPLLDMARHYPADSNEAKRTFRFTVPLLARLSGLGYPATVAIRFAAWLALPALLLALARRAGLDPLAAAGAALAIMGTTTGTCVWRDDCLWFDNVAHTLIATAMLARPRWLIVTAIVLAGFTDERIFVVMPLVLWWHWMIRDPGASARDARAPAAAVIGGVVLALTLRAGLALGLGLTLPFAKVATAKILQRNLALLPLAWWAALEGGWLLLGSAIGKAWSKPRVGVATLAVATVLPLSAAMFVEDFSRSCSYAFPATICALALLPRAEPARWRRLCGAAAVVSLLVPNVLVSGFIQIEPALPWWRAQFVFVR